MPRKIVSKQQAALAGAIAGGQKTGTMMGFKSRDEAKEALRGLNIKALPKRKKS